MRTSNQVATLDEAKAEFEASWKQVEGVGGNGGGAVKHIVTGIVVSFAVILTASWWLLGSTVPGILLFIVGAAD